VSRGRKTQAPYSWTHWLYANGGSWGTPEGKPAINTPAAIAATQQYVRLLRNYGDPGVTDNGPMEVQSLFLQGRAAMILDAVTWGGIFNDSTRSKVVGKWAGALAPPGPAGVTYELSAWSLAMSPFSQKQRQHGFSSSGRPARRCNGRCISAASRCRGNLSGPTPNGKSKMEPGWYEAALIQAQNSRPIGHPPFVAAPEVTDIVGIAINNALAGKDVKTEMDAAAKKMAEVLEKTEPKTR